MLEVFMTGLGFAAFLLLIWLLWMLFFGKALRKSGPGMRAPLIYSRSKEQHYGRTFIQPQPMIRRTEPNPGTLADPKVQRDSGDHEELRRLLLRIIEEEADTIKEILSRHQATGSRCDPASASSEKPPALQTTSGASERQVADVEGDRTFSFSQSCDRYNEALGNQEVRSEFRARYDPLVISVVNAIDRRRDEKLEPVFKTASDGNFLAIQLPEGKRFAVFPKFGLILQESSFGPGAVGEVFECANFNARFSYPDFRVLRPAVFVPKGEEDWDLKHKGVLDIGTGQEA